ncbi:uncharacterized protein LOC135103306 [Scylla paramamosain]|uniref:uncharacterized protein LOC135103306 n=1 Tax=Scylla paramamosain TaxID=85552 RepID=UPI00308374E3
MDERGLFWIPSNMCRPRHSAPQSTRSSSFWIMQCHMTLHTTEYAISIVIITLPLHTNDKLQSLDISIFAPFKSCLRTIVTDYTLMYPHTHITEHMLPEFAFKAWIKAYTPTNVLSGFSATGIWSISDDIFTDEAFLGAKVSERTALSVDEAIRDAPHEDEGGYSTTCSSINSDDPALEATPGRQHSEAMPLQLATPFPAPTPTTSTAPSYSKAGLDFIPEAIRSFSQGTWTTTWKEREEGSYCIVTENEEAISDLRDKAGRNMKSEEQGNNKKRAK